MITPLLFDLTEVYARRIHNDASARNAIGELAAEYACNALRLIPLPVDGRQALCPDAKSPKSGSPWEIKSVGRNGRALIYKWRIEKELASPWTPYWYCFVRHDCPITVRSGQEIVAHFIQRPPSLHIATAQLINQVICSAAPPRSFRIHTGEKGTVIEETDEEGQAQEIKEKAKHGSQRKGYVDGGWQFALSQLPLVGSRRRIDVRFGGKLVRASVTGSLPFRLWS